MRRILPTMVLTAIVSGTLLAQDSGQLDRCMEKAKTQLAMNSCANEEALRTEAELKGLQQKLTQAARKEPGALDKIGAAARAWIAYRDAYMEAMYPAKDKQAAYGSIPYGNWSSSRQTDATTDTGSQRTTEAVVLEAAHEEMGKRSLSRISPGFPGFLKWSAG